MKNSKNTLKLLPLNALKKTGNVDHADWNYKFLLGYIQRQRFELILKLINNYKFENLLEVGYGSGIFLPQLSKHAEKIYGIDIHLNNKIVEETLLNFGTKAKLYSGSVEKIPFEDNFFDALISVSALEFVNDLDAACIEIRRILKNDGNLFVVTPGHSKLLDLGLKILTGESAAKDYGNKRERTIPVLTKYFNVKEQLFFPGLNLGIRLYTALQLSPKK